MVPTPWAVWQGLSPLARGLALFAVVACVAVDIVLYAVWAQTTALHHTRVFLMFPFAPEEFSRIDSWRTVAPALELVVASPDARVYESVFFDRHIKFQYPPTALLPFHLLWTIDPDLLSVVAINSVLWLSFAGTVVVVAAIFLLSLRIYLGFEPRERPLEAALLGATAALCALTFYPLAKAFQLGQIQTLLNFLFALVALLWLRGRRFPAGALAAVVCLVKPQLGLLVLWAALRRRWRFVAGWAVVFAPVAAVALWVYGLENHLDYLRVLSFIGSRGEGYYPNQSVNGLLNRLLFNGNNTEWLADSFAPYNTWVYAGTTLTSLALIAAALLFRRRQGPGGAGAIDLSIAVLSFTMASPVAWEHHYGVLMPVFAVALPATLAAPALRRAGVAWLAASYLLASNFYPAANHLADTGLNVLQSYLFLGALMLLLHLYRLGRAQAAPAGVGAPARGRAAGLA